MTQGRRSIFKGGGGKNLSVPLIGVQNPQFEPPIWGTYATMKAHEGNLIVTAD